MRRTSWLLAFFLLIGTAFAALPAPARADAPSAPSASIQTPFAGQKFTIDGSLGTSGSRQVVLERYKIGQWQVSKTATTSKFGGYSFTTVSKVAVRKFRVVAPAANGESRITSPVLKVKTQADTARLTLTRDAANLIVVGSASPKRPGRAFALQVKEAVGWTTVGNKFAENARGRLTSTVPLDGKHDYRLVGDPVEGSSGAVSDTVRFDPGPKVLGPHAIFVTTDSGSAPSAKGRDSGDLIIDTSGSLRVDSISVPDDDTAGYPKSAYQLTFAENQTPLGLPRGTSFVLLPNYPDRSLVRTAVGLDLAAQLDGLKWTPHHAFSELFVNGSYRGSYEIVESIAIDNGTRTSRVAVNPATGVLVSIDPTFKQHRIPGFFGRKQLPYAFPAGGDATPAKVAAAKAKIQDFEKALYGPDFTDPERGWQRYLDLNSAVDFYLAKEFVKDWDGDFYRNTFFSIDDVFDPSSKLVLGPVWEADRSAGVKSSGTSSVTSPKGWWLNGDGGGHLNSSDNVHSRQWFVRITKDPAFQAALQKRWVEKRAVFEAAGNAAVDTAVAQIGAGVPQNDRARWAAATAGKRYQPRAKTYAGEIAFLKKWYRDRYSWMNSQLS